MMHAYRVPDSDKGPAFRQLAVEIVYVQLLAMSHL